MGAEHGGPAPLEFGLLGQVLGHSYSPQVHALLGSVPYELRELPDAESVRDFLAHGGFRGLNVTMPYKLVAYECCDELTDVARRLGNVNTVVRRPDGTLLGENTDYHGFTRMMERVGGHDVVSGATCLVLGDGGASRTVRMALEDLGAASVLVVSRRGGLTYEMLAADEGLRGQVGVIVNTTPVGMYPHAADDLLVDPGDFPSLRCVADIVYNPLRTRLIQAAEDLGVTCVGGLEMLVAQAKRSSDLFLGVERPDEVEDEVYARVAGELATVSLIGMPGSGKSGVGRRLAGLLGKRFVDVDELVEAEAGMPIPQIFEELGEEGFRRLETSCTARACANPGLVVATGGGVVTRPENRMVLRSNGPVVLLTRGLDDSGEALPTDGRPLSSSKGVDRIREERAPLYHAWGEICVGPSPEGADVVAREVVAHLVQAGYRFGGVDAGVADAAAAARDADAEDAAADR